MPERTANVSTTINYITLLDCIRKPDMPHGRGTYRELMVRILNRGWSAGQHFITVANRKDELHWVTILVEGPGTTIPTSPTRRQRVYILDSLFKGKDLSTPNKYRS